jgi:hypothetical protein
VKAHEGSTLFFDREWHERVLQWWRDNGVNPELLPVSDIDVTNGWVSYREFKVDKQGHRVRGEGSEEWYLKTDVKRFRPRTPYPERRV